MVKVGAVALESRTIGRDGGYPIVEATLYMYCDACGSFNIKTYIPIIKILLITAVLIPWIFLTINNRQWFLCIIPFGLFALFLPWRDMLLKYKCRNCGNIQITDYNSLNYQSYDISIVDAPFKSTQKRYIDADVPHFQQFT